MRYRIIALLLLGLVLGTAYLVLEADAGPSTTERPVPVKDPGIRINP